MDKPNYSTWGRKDLWTATEASCLLADIEPLLFRAFMNRYTAVYERGAVETDGDVRNSFEIYSAMKDSFDLHHLKYIPARPDQLGNRYLGRNLVRPMACIEWAHLRRLNVPAKLAAAVEQWEATLKAGIK